MSGRARYTTYLHCRSAKLWNCVNIDDTVRQYQIAQRTRCNSHGNSALQFDRRHVLRCGRDKVRQTLVETRCKCSMVFVMTLRRASCLTCGVLYRISEGCLLWCGASSQCVPRNRYKNAIRCVYRCIDIDTFVCVSIDEQ